MGGFIAARAVIDGTQSSPSIPLAQSATSGFYRIGTSLAAALSGKPYFKLGENDGYVGYLAPKVFSMAQIAGSPFAAGGANPYQFDLNPAGTMLAVCNYGDNTLSVYNINTVSGLITAVSGSPFAVGVNPISVSFSSNGKFIAVANYNSTTVSMFTVNPATSIVVAAAGSPTGAGINPRGVVFSTDSRFLFCTNQGSAGLNVYSVSSTGVLTNIAGSPFNVGVGATMPTVSPDGALLAVSFFAQNTIKIFSITAASGVITTVPGSPFATGAGPLSLVFAPDSSRLLVGNHGAATCSVYDVGVSGAIIAVSGSPFAAGTTPTGVDISPDGAYVAISNGGAGNSVTVKTYDSVTGSLVSIAGSPFAVGSGAIWCQYSPDNLRLLVLNYTSQNLTIFSDSVGGEMPLLSMTFDPTGSSGGTVSINGTLYSMGEPLLTKTRADILYASYAGGTLFPALTGNAGKFVSTDGVTFKYSGVTQALPAVMAVNAGAFTVDDSGMYVVDITGALTAAGALTGTLTYPAVPVHVTFHNSTTGGFPVVLNATWTIPQGTTDWYWNGATFHFEGGEAFRTADVTPLPAAGAVVATNHLCGTNALIAGLECVCLTAEFGYTAGDVVQAIEQSTGAASDSLCLWINTTQVGFSLAATYAIAAHDKATGAQVVLTAANWAYRFRVQP